MLRLRRRERRRRLVECERPAVERERAGNLQKLPVRDRQRLDGGVRRHRQVQPRQERARPLAHRAFAQPAEPARQLASGEDVAGYREIRKQQHLLMHQADPARQRVARRCERNRLPVEPQLAAIGLQFTRENLEQRGLAGAVLANDRVRLAGIDREADVAQRVDRAEGFVM